jgi:hypothetical protein
MGTLNGLSFHSVKGGVGKSTLATWAGLDIARRFPEAHVWLIDMDLTGTSLSDALPLTAPRLSADRRGGLNLRVPATDWLTKEETREGIVTRSVAEDPTTPTGVPYLNDFLLFADASWEADQDAVPGALGWRLEGGPENLHVLPSSALPQDLWRTVPVIFDEEHAAFLEARLELLLAAMCREAGDADLWVVFDVPPTLPGLSRAVLSLCLRLSRPPGDRTPLAELDPEIPAPLDTLPIRWVAQLVCSMDRQDLRAAKRWADLVTTDDLERVRALFNRLEPGDAQRQPAEFLDLLRARLGGAEVVLPALWGDELVRVPDAPDLRVFQDDLGPQPQVVIDLMEQLLAPFSERQG